MGRGARAGRGLERPPPRASPFASARAGHGAGRQGSDLRGTQPALLPGQEPGQLVQAHVPRPVLPGVGTSWGQGLAETQNNQGATSWTPRGCGPPFPSGSPLSEVSSDAQKQSKMPSISPNK